MRRYVIAAALLLAAASAHGIGVAVGVFGGAAIPTCRMATRPGAGGSNIYFSAGADLGLSPKLGVKVTVGTWRNLEAEAAVAYHLGHAVKDWQDNAYVEEPKNTLIPVTAGANYRLQFGAFSLYAGGGGGYYFEKLKGGLSWNYGNMEIIYYATDTSLDGPGLYAGGGVTYAFGPFAIDVNPRYNVIFNEGSYNIEGPGWAPVGRRYVIQASDVPKNYNDTYLDIYFGVNYYFM